MSLAFRVTSVATASSSAGCNCGDSMLRCHTDKATSTCATPWCGTDLATPRSMHHTIVWTHTQKLRAMAGMGSAALAAAVANSGKATWISHKDRRRCTQKLNTVLALLIIILVGLGINIVFHVIFLIVYIIVVILIIMSVSSFAHLLLTSYLPYLLPHLYLIFFFDANYTSVVTLLIFLSLYNYHILIICHVLIITIMIVTY